MTEYLVQAFTEKHDPLDITAERTPETWDKQTNVCFSCGRIVRRDTGPGHRPSARDDRRGRRMNSSTRSATTRPRAPPGGHPRRR